MVEQHRRHPRAGELERFQDRRRFGKVGEAVAQLPVGQGDGSGRDDVCDGHGGSPARSRVAAT